MKMKDFLKKMIFFLIVILIFCVGITIYATPIPQERIRKVKEYAPEGKRRAAEQRGSGSIYGEFCDFNSVLDYGLKSGMDQAENRKQNWEGLSVIERFMFKVSQ
jgi:hypothetical protein